jgi:hypothetical protein
MPEISYKSNVWGERLTSLTLAFVGLSFIGILILGSYYDQPITQALSFTVQDNERFDSGLGLHSFGDFQDIRYSLPTEKYPNVWINSYSAYPPASLIPNFLAKIVQLEFGVQKSLYVYLFALICCLSVPAVYAARTIKTTTEKVLAFLLLSIFTQPVIMAFDRGNSVAFALPFIFFFALNFLRQRIYLASIFLVGATAVRPQFILLGLALLITRGTKAIIASTISSLSIFFVSFLFMPGPYSTNIQSWYSNLRNYANGSSAAYVFPANLSLSTSFGGFISPAWYSKSMVVVLSFIILIFYIFKTSTDRPRILIISLSLPTLIPAVTYGYYSIFVIVIAAFIIINPTFLDHLKNVPINSLTRVHRGLNNFYNYLLITIIAVSLAPIPFVMQLGRNSIALENFSSIWLVVLIATLCMQIYSWWILESSSKFVLQSALIAESGPRD